MSIIHKIEKCKRKMSFRKMGITYELISKLEQLEYFPKLLRTGIIPINWLDYKVIYEFYLIESKKASGKQLITNVAQEFNISERKVYFIVQKMNG